METSNRESSPGTDRTNHQHDDLKPAATTTTTTTTKSKMREGIKKLPKEIRNIFAGGVAGMVAKSVVAPFDRIKILFQISSAKFQIHKVPAVAGRIVREEGLGALWKGNFATMIRVFPYSGIQFMVYDRCKTFIMREKEILYARRLALDPHAPKPKWGLTPQESLVSGMVAGAVSVVCTYPLDLARTQLAVLRQHKDRALNRTFSQVIMHNYQNGVRSRSKYAYAESIF